MKLNTTCVIVMSFLSYLAIGQEDQNSDKLKPKTLHSKIEIRKECEEAYKKGSEVFSDGVKSEQSSPSYYTSRMSEVSKDCIFAYSSGIFDAQAVFVQTLLMEYVLEKNWANRQHFNRRDKLIKQIDHYFKKRLDKASISADVLELSLIHIWTLPTKA